MMPASAVLLAESGSVPAGAPAYVNAGVLAASTAATATPALPASRVTGNLLIAFISANSATQTFAVSAGWTLGGDLANASGPGAGSNTWAWRLVTGSEAAPVFTWTTSGAYTAQVLQFSGVSATPMGAHAFAPPHTGSSNTILFSSITTTHANSLVAAIALAGGSQTLPAPAGWTQNSQTANANRSNVVASLAFPTSGSAASPPSITSPLLATYTTFTIEIKSP